MTNFKSYSLNSCLKLGKNIYTYLLSSSIVCPSLVNVEFTGMIDFKDFLIEMQSIVIYLIIELHSLPCYLIDFEAIELSKSI